MRPAALALVVVLSASPLLRAQSDDPGLPGGPVLPSQSGRAAAAPPPPPEPVPPEVLGVFALRGQVYGDQETWLATARLEVRRGPAGLTVRRHGAVTLVPGATRRTVWTAATAVMQFGGLVVTYRPVDAWVEGIAESLDGAGRQVERENFIEAHYAFTAEGVRESLLNTTRRAPEHYWGGSSLAGPRLRPDDLALGPAVSTLVDHGPAATRYDIAIVSEGYTPEEIPVFRADARAVVERLRATSPFTDYWGYVNVHRVELVSAGSGIAGGRGGPGVLRTRLEGGRSQTPSGSRSRVSEAARLAPGADVVVVLVNDDFRSVAHSGYTFVSAFDHLRLPYVAVHELGHSLGFLLDEYEEHPRSRWDFVFANDWVDGMARWGGWGANLTTHTGRDSIPWREWIPAGVVPLPTPAGSGHEVGLYQGGMARSRGWYRPTETCLMRDETQPFCVVCREALVLRLSQRARPVEVTVTRIDRDTVRLAVESRVPGPIRVTWIRNGAELMEGATAVLVTRDNQPWGTSDLEVVVEDATPWVRNDPQEWTVYRVRFTLEKGQVWTKGLGVKGPYYAPPRERPGEEVFRLFDRG